MEGKSLRPNFFKHSTNPSELPSSAGSSGPSTSTFRLSIPRPPSAARQCSTVFISTPFCPSEVQRFESKPVVKETFRPSLKNCRPSPEDKGLKVTRQNSPV